MELLIRAGYVGTFGVAGIVCYASVYRALQITDDDIKRGLVALLLFSGTWAVLSAGRLTTSIPEFQITAYIIGLTVGLGTVGAWLYFCSAYAGHEYHQQTNIRLTALLMYVVITGVKLTNPLHSLYFTTSQATVPFEYLTISYSVVHWVVTGLAYALTAIGFYLLYELFRESQLETTKLGILVGFTAVPVIVDMVAFAGLAPAYILPLNYEPIGVALFAVGVLFIVDETFIAVPRKWRKDLIAQLGNPIILLTHDDTVRDYNAAAAAQFVNIKDSIGKPLETVSPQLYSSIASSNEIIEFQRDDVTQYYTVQTQELCRGEQLIGRALVYKDVTDIERQRRELKRHNDQLDEFSTALNHELRNAITIVQGFVDYSAQSVASEPADANTGAVDRANTAITRMETSISDLSLIARYGQTPSCYTDCELRKTVEAAWDTTATDGMSYTVETDAVVVADQSRLEKLFQNAFRFAKANEATVVSIDMTDDVLTITTDGMPLAPDVIEDALEFGPPVPKGDADMSLPNLRLLARVHDWETEIDPSYSNGVRLDISGVTTAS